MNAENLTGNGAGSHALPCCAFFVVNMPDGTRWKVPLKFAVDRCLAENPERETSDDDGEIVVMTEEEALQDAIEWAMRPEMAGEHFAGLSWEDVAPHAEKLPEYESKPALLWPDALIELSLHND